MDELEPIKPRLPRLKVGLTVLIIVLALPWVVNFKATLGVVVSPIYAWTQGTKAEGQVEVPDAPEVTTGAQDEDAF